MAFTLQATNSQPDVPADLPVTLFVQGESLRLAWKDGRTMELRLLAPPRSSGAGPSLEVVETNRFFRWERLHFPDALWPRVIESRLDALGGVTLVAHVQRRNTGDHFAPELGWRLWASAKGVLLRCGQSATLTTNQTLSCSFAAGNEATCILDDQLSVYHPSAHLKRRGDIEVVPGTNGLWTCCYRRSRPADKVPMQPTSWQRAEMVIAPQGLARLTPSLNSPHRVQVDAKLWSELYESCCLKKATKRLRFRT